MEALKRKSIQSHLVVLFAFGLLFSCDQLAPEEAPVQVADEFVDMSGVALEPDEDPKGARLVYSSDCESDCIEPGSGNYFAIRDTKSKSSGINTKKVSYKAYNTEDRFVVKAKYEITAGPSQAKATITIQINGKKKEFKSVPSGYTATFSIPLDKGWDKCDLVTFSISQKGLGSPISFSDDYNMIPVCKVEKGLILWNKLGSLFEVENSEVGPGGTPAGEIDFGIAKFGNGVIPKLGDAGSGVDFQNTIFNPEKGTIEFWLNAYYLPKWYEYGIYVFLLNKNQGSNPQVMNLYWHVPDDLFFILPFEEPGESIYYDTFIPKLNVPVHIAVVWDRQGIDNSDQTKRMYVNGELVSSGTGSDWGGNSTGISRIAAGIDLDYGENRFAMDNIKVWNYAKTDFSDRDTEGH